MGDHAAGLGRSGANLEAKPEHRSAAAAAPLRHHLQGERHEHVRDPALGSRAVLPFGGCLRAASGQTDETRAAARTAASRASPSPCGSARRRPPPAGTTRSVAANAHVAVTDHGRCWLQASWTSTLARPAPPQSLQRLLQHPGALLQSALESSRHNTVVHHDTAPLPQARLGRLPALLLFADVELHPAHVTGAVVRVAPARMHAEDQPAPGRARSCQGQEMMRTYQRAKKIDGEAAERLAIRLWITRRAESLRWHSNCARDVEPDANEYPTAGIPSRQCPPIQEWIPLGLAYGGRPLCGECRSDTEGAEA